MTEPVGDRLNPEKVRQDIERALEQVKLGKDAAYFSEQIMALRARLADEAAVAEIALMIGLEIAFDQSHNRNDLTAGVYSFDRREVTAEGLAEMRWRYDFNWRPVRAFLKGTAAVVFDMCAALGFDPIISDRLVGTGQWHIDVSLAKVKEKFQK